MLVAFKNIPRPNDRSIQTVANTRLHDHICLIYRDKQEALVTASAFIKAGLEQNDQCVYVADDNSTEDVNEALKQVGIKTKSVQGNSQLITATKQNSYLIDGVFDPDKSIGFFADASKQAEANGYRAVRGAAEMSWQLGGSPGSERLLEYESKMNRELFPKYKAVGLCQYSAERFSPEILREVIYTHPVVIIGGLVCKNFYYKPPEEYTPSNENGAAEKEVSRMLTNIFEFERNELELKKSKEQLLEANSQLEKKVLTRTSELEKRAKELRQLNVNFVGREYRIRELEAENNQLKSRLNQLIEQVSKGLESQL
ncbi:MEDS domain-containing protein [Candidatus Parcubacteria bacterium]|nr:MEDS domain-containing protein [Candidatus Parcubacteria bacterium]